MCKMKLRIVDLVYEFRTQKKVVQRSEAHVKTTLNKSFFMTLVLQTKQNEHCPLNRSSFGTLFAFRLRL